MKKLITLLVLVLLLAGCSDAKETVETQTANDVSSADSLDEDFYRIVKLDRYEKRDDYYNSFGNTDDFQTIGRELQTISTEYFSTDDYYMSEGQNLTRSNVAQLVERDDSNPDKYPHTLENQAGTAIGGIDSPNMITTIYEQDFYQKSGDDYVLKGASLAIVLDPTDASGDALLSYMDESAVVEFGQQTIRNLYEEIQNYNEDDENAISGFKELKNQPLLITGHYAANSNESDIDGRYILKSYCDGSLGDIETLDYHTYLFTSSEASQADEETYSQFEIFKNNMKNASFEAVGVVGYGRYKDGEIQSMRININVNVKTYTELVYLVETAADEVNSQFSNDFDITVQVSSQDQLEAIIIKDQGEDARSILLY